jgi:hypothetical protein
VTERAAIRFVVTAHTCVRAKPYPTAPIIRAAHVGEALEGERVAGLAHHGSVEWARVTLPSGVTGYVWSGFGEWREA